MAVFIKRFRVRHNGVFYGPGQPGGQILAGLSEEEEARLISGSDGRIVKYETLSVMEPAPTDEEVTDDGKPAPNEEHVDEDDEKPAPTDEEVTDDDSIANLNIDDLIKPGPVEKAGR